MGLREAKTASKRGIEDCFKNNDSRQVWSRVQHTANYRPSSLSANNSDTSLAEKLNCFFARVEVLTLETVPLHPPAYCSHVLIVEEQQVRRMLGTVNPRKAADSDNVRVQVLKDCASQSLSQALHYALSHLEGGYAWLFFVDFSSAFNTILPSRFVSNLYDLGISDSVCHWIKVFLTDRSQRVRVGPHI